MNLRRSLLESVLASGAGAAAGMVGGILLARALGPSARGQVAAVVAWAGALGTLADLGLGFAVGYHAGRGLADTRALVGVALVGAVGAGGLAWAVGGALLWPSLAGPGLDPWLVWFALSAAPLLLVSNHLTNFLLGLGQVRSTNAIRFVSVAAYAIGVAWLYGRGHRSPAWYLGAFWLAQVLGAGTALVVACRQFLPTWQLAGMGKVLGYGLRAHLSSVAAQANIRLDQLLMALFLPSDLLGRYVVAVAVSSMVGPLYTGLSLGLAPRVLREPSTSRAVSSGLAVVLLAVVVGAAGALLIGVSLPQLVPMLFGQDFLEAVGAARILLAASVFQGANQLNGTILRAVGRPGVEGVAQGAGVVVTAGLLWVALPSFGIEGAAWVSLTVYAGIGALQLLVLARVHGDGPASLGADVATIARAAVRSVWKQQ